MNERLRLDQVRPELRRAYRLFPTPPVRHTWQRRLSRVGIRLLPPPRPRDGTSYRFERLGPGAGVHVFTPAGGGCGAALLWIHGGGMVIGGAAQDHAWCAGLARGLGIVVVSVEYRLAPEHPYPAPLDDCAAAWHWLAANSAELGVSPQRTAIGGQSAGGGLAAGLVLRIHDDGGAQPAAQWLFCPMLDDRTAADRTRDGIRHFLWDNRSNRAGWSAYLSRTPPEAVPAYAAPARREDLTGLPPTWIGTGAVELFFDENREYARRLDASGVDCELDIVDGAPHAFEKVAPGSGVARSYTARARAWLGQRLSAPAA